jgi:hypothetical protein
MRNFRAKFIAGFVVLATVLSGSAVQAEDGNDKGRFRIGVTGGTLGVGPEASYRISDTIGIRGDVTFLSLNADIDSDDLTYNANLKLQSGGVMIDVFPTGGGFRLSGGLRINGNRARAVGVPNAGVNYVIDGMSYTASEIGTLAGETTIKRVAPALTIGYGGKARPGFAFGIDAGVLFQGRVRIKPLTITGICAGSGAPPSCATLAADLEAERQSVNDDIKKYRFYPILQVSAGYRF